MMNIILLCFMLLFLGQSAFSNPSALYVDPGAIYTVHGVDRFPTNAENWTCDLYLSPFYQHSPGTRNYCGKRVAMGDRLGYSKMLPIIWGNMAAAPKEFNKTNYPVLYTLVDNALNFKEPGVGISPDTYGGTADTDGDWSVSTTYERKGLRLEIDMSLASGFGLTIKSGAVEYIQKPVWTDISISKKGDPDPNVNLVGTFLHDYLMTETKREAMFQELGLCLDPYSTTAFEDTFCELYWANPFKCENCKGEHTASITPYIGAGVWIPTGKKKDQDIAFSLPVGHDGFWGVTLEGALNFEFPKTLIVNVGGGLTVFETRHQVMRVPNQQWQSTMYPFKTMVRRTFGPAWNVNLSMQANDIVENLSVFFDYLYSKHEHDSISLGCGGCDGFVGCETSCNECINTCACGTNCSNEASGPFFPRILENDSMWKAHTVHLGFEYDICKNLALGISGQTHISGSRVFRTITVLGSVKLTF